MHKPILERNDLTMHAGISQRSRMKSLPLLGALAFLIVGTTSIHAQQSAPAEKIRDISPNKKFAMRISYDGEMNKQLVGREDRPGKDLFRDDQGNRVSDAAREE